MNQLKRDYYIDNGILRTLQINHDVNFDWSVTKTINGKTDYIYPGKYFRELMIQRYGQTKNIPQLPKYIN